MKVVIADGPNGVGVVTDKMEDFDNKVTELIEQAGCDEQELLYKYTDALLIYEYHIDVVDLGGHEMNYIVSHSDKERADLQAIRIISELGKVKFIKSFKFEVTVLK